MAGATKTSVLTGISRVSGRRQLPYHLERGEEFRLFYSSVGFIDRSRADFPRRRPVQMMVGLTAADGLSQGFALN